MCEREWAGLLADGDSQAEENPGFLDTLLTILETEQNAGIRLSGMSRADLRARERGGTCWGNTVEKRTWSYKTVYTDM